jgi:hypothetical protein
VFDKYGMMVKEDEDVMDTTLAALLPNPKVRVLEIGTYSGDTARGMKRFLEAHGSSIEYWGIDPSLVLHIETPPPFPGATMIREKSEEAFHLVPDDLHFVFVDGNHSRNSVILDIYNYSTKVVPGGFMVFHDTNPSAQGTGYEYSGPQIPQFGIAVLEAWKLIGWPWKPWQLFMTKYPLDSKQNGATAFRRMA